MAVISCWMFFVLAVVIGQPGDAVGITYYTQSEALKELFPDAEHVEHDRHVLTDRERALVKATLRHYLKEREWVFYRGMVDHEVIGYAVKVNQIGKHRPISFMIRISPLGSVENMLVMVYRERIGGQIRRRRFLKQFRGVTADRALRVGHDVDSITGATMSVRASIRAIREALAVWGVIYAP